MKRFDAPLAVGLGAAIVLATNVFILGAAWWNRSGEPESRLVVTERELEMPLWRDKDETGLILALTLADRPPAAVFRTTRFRNDRVPPFELPWFDSAKLAALGFDLRAMESAARNERPEDDLAGVPARRAFVVLEYDGDAWRAWLASREAAVAETRDRVERGVEDRGKLSDAEALLALDRASRSRLVPVDAGLDASALRTKYADRSRYAVVPGFIGARATVPEGGTAAIRGTIERVAVERISVPRQLLPQLVPFVPQGTENDVNRRAREDAAAARWPAPAAPRYRATVAYGRGLDPWLVDVAPVSPAEPGATGPR